MSSSGRHPWDADDPYPERGRLESGCDRCEEPGVGYNDDGVFLCEDCLFEEACDAMMSRDDDADNEHDCGEDTCVCPGQGG